MPKLATAAAVGARTPAGRRRDKGGTMRTLFTTVVALAALTASAPATLSAGSLPELPRLLSNDVVARPLKAGTTYQSTTFPLPFHVTPPDATWFGGQGIQKYKAEPAFGWFELLQSPPAIPDGMISVITAVGATPSVAAMVKTMRFGTDATFQATKKTKVAGYPASYFDGEVTAKHQLFIPFTPRTKRAAYHPDAYQFSQGEVFRIIVAAIKGKTVVFLIENNTLPADQFPSFLTATQKILDTLRFS